MSPRRNRPRESREPDEPRSFGALPAPAPAGWRALNITRERAEKTYVCPGCETAIPPRTPHVVAWRHGEDELRRHWHRACWDRERATLG